MTEAEKSPINSTRRGVSRRQLLAGGASAGTALAVGGALVHRASASSSTTPQYHLQVLSTTAAALYGAMADRVFPADDSAPAGSPGAASATTLGFVPYFDGQLDSAWGSGDGFYRHGPFHEATTSGLGYQMPLVPKDLYPQIATKIDAHVQSSMGKPFDQLTASQQDQVMSDMEDGKVDLGYATTANGYTSAEFFADFLSIVNQALFADPMYGGNKDVGGWSWVGYSRRPDGPMATPTGRSSPSRTTPTRCSPRASSTARWAACRRAIPLTRAPPESRWADDHASEGRRGDGRSRLDGRDPRLRVDQGRDESRRAGARSPARHRGFPERPRRARLRRPRQALSGPVVRDPDAAPQPLRTRAAAAPSRRLAAGHGRRRRRNPLERSDVAFSSLGLPAPLPLRGALRQGRLLQDRPQSAPA